MDAIPRDLRPTTFKMSHLTADRHAPSSGVKPASGTHFHGSLHSQEYIPRSLPYLAHPLASDITEPIVTDGPLSNLRNPQAHPSPPEPSAAMPGSSTSQARIGSLHSQVLPHPASPLASDITEPIVTDGPLSNLRNPQAHPSSPEPSAAIVYTLRPIHHRLNRLPLGPAALPRKLLM